MRNFFFLLPVIILFSGCTGDKDVVRIVFEDNSVAVTNPLAERGVEVSVCGTEVTASNNSKEAVTFELAGTCSDGCVRITGLSPQKLRLAGLSLSCADGPAINIQSHAKTNVVLVKDFDNVIADGAEYAPSDEDRKATFFSEGGLVFSGSGTLTVQGSTHHALCSDDFITVSSGTLNIHNPAPNKDGIHVKDDFIMSGGTVTVNSTADGDTLTVDNVVTAFAPCCIESKGTATLLGGTLTLLNSGRGGKGLNVASDLTIGASDTKGPILTIKTTGQPVGDMAMMMPPPGGPDFFGGPDGPGFPDDFEFPDFPGGGFPDGDFPDGFPEGFPGGDFPDGFPGEGFPEGFPDGFPGGGFPGGGFPGGGFPEGGFPEGMMPPPGGPMGGPGFGPGGPMGNGNAAHKYAKAIRAAGDIFIHSGIITLDTSSEGGEGLESKQSILIDGGDIVCHTYDDCINASHDIIIRGGRVFCVSTGNDAIDCNVYDQGAIYIEGGITLALSSRGNPEEGLDSDFAPIHVSGGYLFTMGGTLGPAPSVPTQQTALQPTCCLAGVALSEGSHLCVTDEKGNALFSLKIPFSMRRSYSLCSAPQFQLGSTYHFVITDQEPAARNEWQGFLTGIRSVPSNTSLQTVTFETSFIRK